MNKDWSEATLIIKDQHRLFCEAMRDRKRVDALKAIWKLIYAAVDAARIAEQSKK